MRLAPLILVATSAFAFACADSDPDSPTDPGGSGGANGGAGGGGGGAGGPGPATLADAISAYEATLGAPPNDCGQIDCITAADPTPAGLSCIQTAAANCTAARLVQHVQGTDSDWDNYFYVSPSSDGSPCRLSMLVDNTRDCFGARELASYACTGPFESPEPVCGELECASINHAVLFALPDEAPGCP